jgi:hypothetical protein
MRHLIVGRNKRSAVPAETRYSAGTALRLFRPTRTACNLPSRTQKSGRLKLNACGIQFQGFKTTTPPLASNDGVLKFEVYPVVGQLLAKRIVGCLFSRLLCRWRSLGGGFVVGKWIGGFILGRRRGRRSGKWIGGSFRWFFRRSG